jgi:hypothetical protein
MEEITGKASLVQLLSPRSLAAPRTLPATSEGVVTTAYQPGSETASSIALGKPGTLPPTVIHTSTDSVKDSRVTTEIPSPATQIEPPAVHPLGPPGQAVFTPAIGTGLAGALPSDPPRELAKTALPPYIIEPPDVLLVEALGRSAGLRDIQPIRGQLLVRPDGTIGLGTYGSVHVGGLTLDQAREAIANLLRTRITYKAEGNIAIILRDLPVPPKAGEETAPVMVIPQGTLITVGGVEFVTDQEYTARMQPAVVAHPGERPLVRWRDKDGSEKWRFWIPIIARQGGSAGNVTRDTAANLPAEVKPANFERAFALNNFTGGGEFDARDLNVDVRGYNSKFYYVITDGGGYGEQVYPFLITGSETVLDALGRIQGLPVVADRRKVWVARRGHGSCGQILPVDWVGIARKGATSTNFQVLPGDRIYVKADTWISADSWIAKRLSPIERLFGATLLGSQTVNSITGRGLNTNIP